MHVNSNVKTVLTTLKEITAYYQMTSFVFKDFPFHAIQLESNKEEDKILSRELLSTDLLFHVHVHVHSWDIVYADAGIFFPISQCKFHN